MIRRVAVFLPNWVGDAVMATPTLRALRRRFGPEAEIVGIMKPVVEDVLRGAGLVDRVWRYDPSSPDFALRPPGLLLRMLRRRIDLSVHLTNDRFSAGLARLGLARMRAGYDRNGRGWLLTHRLRAPHDGQAFTPISALDYYLAIAYALGCERESSRMELATEPADEAAADRAWRDLGIAADEAVVLLNSSGAFGNAKLWPDEHFGALARRIARELDHTVVVLCGPAERERAARIADIASHPRVLSLAEQAPSIGLTKACVRRGRCLVSTDSGPRHFGAAFGIGVVALFGPTHVAWSDTHYDREIRMQHEVPCGPCQQRECPEGHHACMRNLSVDAVFDAVFDAVSAAVERSVEQGGAR